MFQQIISHTPTYVWALLAFLVYRGVLAMRDRELSLKALFIIPAVMLYLSLQDLDHRFSMSATVLAFWASGALVGAVLVWCLSDAAAVVGHRASGTVRVRGSWVPLALMLAIFTTKYTVAVLLAIRPDWQHSLPVELSVCLLFGLFNGVFFGRLARALHAYAKDSALLPA